MTGETSSKRQFRIGFQTSIITVFVGVMLLVGLTLVCLSFERATSITRTAASGFIEKVAQIGADHVDEQFKDVRDNLDIHRAISRPTFSRGGKGIRSCGMSPLDRDHLGCAKLAGRSFRRAKGNAPLPIFLETHVS